MKNKFILITLIFFIIFSFSLSSFSSAINIKFTYNDKNYEISDFEHYDNFVVGINYSFLDIYSFSSDNVKLLGYDNPNSTYLSNVSFSFTAGEGGCNVCWTRIDKNSGKTISVLYKDNLFVAGKGAATSFGYGFAYSTMNIYDQQNNLFFGKVNSNPFVVNRDEVFSGNFKSLVINTGDFSINDNLTLSVNELRPVSNGSDFTYYLNKTKKFDLDSSMEGLTLTNAAGTNSIFSIPSSKFFVFTPGYKYEFIIKKGTEELCYESFVCGEIPAEDKEQQEKDKQLELQEEQNKTNKGIWETLKEVLSFINPFSENFFVYKLLELMANLIKSLFIPSDDFFTNWINNMNDWLSDRLGALYYPVDLVVDFLNRIGELSSTGSAVISGDGFEFMGAKLIPAFSYDLNSLLTNDTLKNIHDIYLTVVDVILYLCLIVLAKNTFVDLFGGKYDDGLDIAAEGIDGSLQTQENFKKSRSSLENRRAKYNYYGKRRSGKI